MLHATIHWPEQQHLHLWPYAFKHVVFSWNNLPGHTSRVTPLEIFTGVAFDSFAHLQCSHVWGCPIYVLDPKLQDGKKLQKWHARARCGQYLGISPEHSSTIGHILSLCSGFISPQYHLFSMVPNAESGGTLEPEMDGNFWCKLIATSYESLLPDNDDETLPDLHPDWLTNAELRARNRNHTPTQLHPPPPLPVPFLPVLPSVAEGNPGPNQQQQPCANRHITFAPEGAEPLSPPPFIPEGANDTTNEMEIVFEDDPEATNNGEDTADHQPEHHDLFGLPDPEQYG